MALKIFETEQSLENHFFPSRWWPARSNGRSHPGVSMWGETHREKQPGLSRENNEKHEKALDSCWALLVLFLIVNMITSYYFPVLRKQHPPQLIRMWRIQNHLIWEARYHNQLMVWWICKGILDHCCLVRATIPTMSTLLKSSESNRSNSQADSEGVWTMCKKSVAVHLQEICHRR